jgi:hypothetical protein
MMDVDLPCHQTVSVIYGAWFGHDVTLTSLEQEYIFSKTYKGLQHVYKRVDRGQYFYINIRSHFTTFDNPSSL